MGGRKSLTAHDTVGPNHNDQYQNNPPKQDAVGLFAVVFPFRWKVGCVFKTWAERCAGSKTTFLLTGLLEWFAPTEGYQEYRSDD